MIHSERKNNTLSIKKIIANKNHNTDKNKRPHLELLTKHGWQE